MTSWFLQRVISTCPRDYCDLHQDQHDLDYKSRGFLPAVLALGICLLLCRSICTRCSRKTLSHTLSCFRMRLPIVLAMKASERLNTQDSTSWTSDNSGRNKVWNFSSSVFMITGDADSPWHLQFFSAATFESQSLTEEKRSWSIWQPPRCHGSSPAVSPCLFLLTFMTIHLFQFRFADTEQYWLMTRLCFDKPLEILLAFLRQKNTCVLCW